MNAHSIGRRAVTSRAPGRCRVAADRRFRTGRWFDGIVPIESFERDRIDAQLQKMKIARGVLPRRSPIADGSTVCRHWRHGIRFRLHPGKFRPDVALRFKNALARV